MASPCYLNQLKYEDVITKEDEVDIRRYALDTYINQGKELSEAITGVSKDLGLPAKWVTQSIAEAKAVRTVTNEMYKRMSDRRQAVKQAKEIVNGLDRPLVKRIFDTVWHTPFAVAVGYHGTVGMQTHAGAALFRPTTWNTYFNNFGRQFKYTNPFGGAGKIAHEAAMQELVRDPNFITAKRAGLANDPVRTYTDYGAYAKWIPKVLGRAMGERGFDVLKKYRQDAFNHEWARVPESIKSDPSTAKDAAKNISEMINHGSGVADIGHGTLATGVNTLAFAAKLEASRWARIIGDPIKTLDTFAGWKDASAADRHIALTRVKHAAEFTGFYFTTLLVNQAIISAFGSKDKINFTDPTRSDWLAHKIAGRTVKLEGQILAPVRLLAQLVYAGFAERKPYQKQESRFETAGKAVASYARGKLAPAAGIAVDVGTGEDFMGNVMPFRSDTPKKGKHQLALGEYAGQRGPIPLSGAIREVYDDFREQGMDAATATNLIRGLAVFGSETTGAKVGHQPTTETTSEPISRSAR
jgi:hypothetical protein